MTELLIKNGKEKGKWYAPIVKDRVTFSLERKVTPGKLEFSVIKDSVIDFSEGSVVRLYVDGSMVFRGCVFSKRRDRDGDIAVVAYDQLRYFKNKDSYYYEGKTATEVIKMITSDHIYRVNSFEDTGYVIESRVEHDKTLFDIVANALDMTLQARGRLFVLHDSPDGLMLRDIQNMKLDCVICADTAENFSYKSSIDEKTYNRVKLASTSVKAGGSVIYTAQDPENIKTWGPLQYSGVVGEDVNSQAMADTLLKLYNKKTRTLSIQGALGDVRVRAGSMLPVSLNLGDIILNNYMFVERVKHVFEPGHHRMDLDLCGHDFDA